MICLGVRVATFDVFSQNLCHLLKRKAGDQTLICEQRSLSLLLIFSSLDIFALIILTTEAVAKAEKESAFVNKHCPCSSKNTDRHHSQNLLLLHTFRYESPYPQQHEKLQKILPKGLGAGRYWR